MNLDKLLQTRPDPIEYSGFNSAYIDQVPDVNIASYLEDQRGGFVQFIREIPADKAQFAYASGKWIVTQVLQHVIDSERVFSYRLLRIARGDKTPLPGYEQDDWAQYAVASDRTLAGLANEFELVRKTTTILLGSLNAEQLMFQGTASDHIVTVRALAWIMAGHVLHHQRILVERYL